MTLAGADASSDRAQGQDVAGSAQRCWCAFGVGQRAAGESAVVGADAGCGERVLGVDGDGVSSSPGILGICDHGRKVEGSCAVCRHGNADVAGGVTDHPSHLFGGDIFGSDDEISFIFARGIVED